MRIFRHRIKEIVRARKGSSSTFINPFRRHITASELMREVFRQLPKNDELKRCVKLELHLPAYALVALRSDTQAEEYMRYRKILFATVRKTNDRWLIALGASWRAGGHPAQYSEDLSAILLRNSSLRVLPHSQIDNTISERFIRFANSIFFTDKRGMICLYEGQDGYRNPFHKSMLDFLRIRLGLLANQHLIRGKPHRHIDSLVPLDNAKEVNYKRHAVKIIVDAIVHTLMEI